MAEYKYHVTEAKRTTNRRQYRRMIMKGPSHGKLKNAQLDLKRKHFAVGDGRLQACWKTYRGKLIRAMSRLLNAIEKERK